MFQSNFSRHANLFDDHQVIPDDRLRRYRSAQPLSISTESGFHSLFGKVLKASMFLSRSTLPHLLSNTHSQSFFHTNDTSSIQEKNVHIISSTVTSQPTESKEDTVIVGKTKVREQLISKNLSTILEESGPQESSTVGEKNHIPNEHVEVSKNVIIKSLESNQAFKPMNFFQDISLTTSLNFKYNENDDSRNLGSRMQEKEQKEFHEGQEPGSTLIKQDPKKDGNIFGNSSTGLASEIRKISLDDRVKPDEEAYGIKRTVTEDKGIDTSDIPRQEDIKNLKNDLNNFEPHEIKSFEAKETDTYQLVINRDEVTDTHDLVEEEKKRTQAEITGLKLRFLQELRKFKEELQLVKKEQSEAKQTVNNSLKGTIEVLLKIVHASFHEHAEKTTCKQRHEILMRQLELTKMKENLKTLRKFVEFTIEKIKADMSKYLQEKGKAQLHKIIEDSVKDKMIRFGLGKLGEMLSDNHSISTDSGHATPKKETQKGKSKSSSKKRTHRLDPAVAEGMMYLLEHEGLKSQFNSDKEFRKKLENIFKTHGSDQVATEMVLNSLTDRSSRKKGETKEVSEHGDKKSRKGSVAQDDQETLSQHPDGESVASDKVSVSGKGSMGKKVKRQYKPYSTFVDGNGDKVFVVQEEINREESD